MPAKHLKLSESLLAMGFFVLSNLEKSISIDDLWEKYTSVRGTPEFPNHHSFDDLVLTLDFLYSLSVINLDSKGGLSRATD